MQISISVTDSLKVPEKQKRDVREKKVKEVTRVVKANDIIKGVNDDENTVSDKEKKLV